MQSSGTIISDLKAAVLVMEDPLLKIFAEYDDMAEFKDETINMRNAILDFLIIQVNPDEIRSEINFNIKTCHVGIALGNIMICAMEQLKGSK